MEKKIIRKFHYQKIMKNYIRTPDALRLLFLHSAQSYHSKTNKNAGEAEVSSACNSWFEKQGMLVRGQ